MKLLKTIRNTLAGLAISSGIFILGVCGAGDQDLISFGQLCLYGILGMVGLVGSVLGTILISNEIDWRSRNERV